MALPYPNLNFVPLDVLTAEEMNQIVANYTAMSTYSHTEIPVGTWIDGKTIYRKVVQISNPQTSNTDYGVVSSKLYEVINIYGGMDGNDGTEIPIPQSDSSSTYSVLFVKPDGTLRGRFSYAGTAPKRVRAIVEYTKKI